MGWWIILGLFVVAIVHAAMLYNGLVTVKNNVSLAWANIDVLLKQRHDEIPKLVEVCRQYRQFEQETLEKVTRARAAVHDAREKQDIGALGQAETTLRSSLGGLFAVAEAYPELKADENFMQLQNRITQLEMRSRTGASSTTARSTSTTYASSSSRIRSSRIRLAFARQSCCTSTWPKSPMSM